MKALCLFLVACAGSRPNLTPASAPAYIAIDAGDAAPEDGFFLSIPGAKQKLLSDRMHDLDMDEKLAQSQAETDQANKRAAKADFCATYCFEIGVGATVVVELIGLAAYSLIKH